MLNAVEVWRLPHPYEHGPLHGVDGGVGPHVGVVAHGVVGVEQEGDGAVVVVGRGEGRGRVLQRDSGKGHRGQIGDDMQLKYES